MAKDSETDSATAEKLEKIKAEELMLDDRPDKKVHKYKPNKTLRAIRRQVYERFYEMRDNEGRKLAEADWELGDKEFQMYFDEQESYDIEEQQRSNLHLPDAFAAIQADQQEKIDRKSRPALEGVESSDEPIEEFVNEVLSYNMNTTDFDYQYYLGKLNAAIRGTSFFWNYYRLEKRNVYDPTDVDEDGNLIYKAREVVDFDDDYTEWVENEYIFVDEKARHINFAVDCVKREILDKNEFRRVYMNKPGFKDVDRVASGGDTTSRSFFKMPKDMGDEDVEILHYCNRAIDAYWVTANNVVIREGPLPTKHKELPLAVLYHYQVPGRFWGLGIPKIIHYLTEERRSIRNINMDRQHLNIDKQFLHNSQFSLDEEDMVSRPHGLISVDVPVGGNLRDAMIPLEYGDVPNSYFRTEEVLLEDIRRAHGIDDRIQGVNVGGTATEAAILKESALKRVNMLSTIAEMDTIIRIGRLKWSNIQFFYPIGRMEKITEKNKEKNKKIEKRITTKGRRFRIIDEGGQKVLSMEDIKGASSLRLDKSMAKYLQGDFDIIVNSSVYAPSSKAIQQTKVTEAFSITMANQATASVIDPVKAVSRLFKVNDEDPDDWVRDNLKNNKEMMMLADSENQIMAAGEPLSPTPEATEEHTLVHLMYTKTAEYQALPEVVQLIIMDHIMGEHENNPNTGSAADMMGAAGLMPGAGGETAPTPPQGIGVNPMGMAADTTEPQVQAADTRGTNFQAPS